MIGRKFPVSVGLVGDAAMGPPALHEKVTDKHAGGYLESGRPRQKRWEQKKQQEIASDASPVRGPQIMDALQEVVDRDAIIANDVGDNTLWFARNFVATDQEILISGYVASMGFGLPAALAAQLVRSDRQVVWSDRRWGFHDGNGRFRHGCR